MIQAYFTSGYAGILVSSYLYDELSVGASTAIFGILGLWACFYIVNWDTIPAPIRNM